MIRTRARLAGLAIVGVLGLALAGCGDESDSSEGAPAATAVTTPASTAVTEATSSSSPPISRIEWPLVNAEPNGYTGRRAEGIVGKVFNVERGQGYVAAQAYTSEDFQDGNTIFYVPERLVAEQPQSGDFIRVSGLIGDAFTGENALGGEVTAATVVADTYKVITALQAAPPPLAVTRVNRTENQSGMQLTVVKVERLASGGRIYLRARNGTSSEASLFDTQAKLVQGSRQVEPETDFELDLPTFSTDILPGISQTAVLSFPRMQPGPARLVLEWYSSDFDISAEAFDVRFRIR